MAALMEQVLLPASTAQKGSATDSTGNLYRCTTRATTSSVKVTASTGL